MSDFHVEVVRIGAIEKHPNADSLSITTIGGPNGYPVILRTGDYRDGDLAVYVPVDAVVPAGDPRWSFLGDHRRIRAKRLRGVFSMGLLTPADPSWEEGRDVAAELAIARYEPKEHGGCNTHGVDTHDPGGCPVYDIEPLRRNGRVLEAGEEVWISEKIHGASARFVFDGTTLHVGSHRRFRLDTEDCAWWKVARRYDLAAKLAAHPGLCFYGEVYGAVQDLKYGVLDGEGLRLVLFDALRTTSRTFLDVDEFLTLAESLDLPVVPTLYRGPWDPSLARLAEGDSMMPGAKHVREGIVVKPVHERFHRAVGRVFLKLAGEGYLLRKGA